jgi:type IV pilus assembly protein PilF
MNARVAIVLGLLAVGAISVSGCVSQPLEREFHTSQNTMGDESETRVRARIHTELAAGYFELGNMGVALEEVNEALRADSTFGPAYNVAGLIYSELREDKLAEQNFERSVRINPLDSDANNNFGRYLCDRKRADEAIKYFLAALRNPLYQNPDRSYVNAGLCSRRRGDIAGAEDFMLKALKIQPNQPQALYSLADIAYARGSFAEAKTYLARASKVTAPSAELLWLGVRVERKLGDRNSEASYGVQLRKNFPESKEARALIAGQYD